MARLIRQWIPALFTIILLVAVNFIRSGVIVDRSFLPRLLLLSLLLLISLVFLRQGISKKNSAFAVAFGLFYLWNLLSCFWAVSASESLLQSQLVFTGLMIFLVISALQRGSPQFERLFIRIQIIALICSFLLAIYQVSGLRYYDPYRVISLSANNNLYSGYLLIALPFVLTGYTRFSGVWKWMAFFTAAAVVFMLIIIQSRAAYLGLITGTFLSVIFIITRFRTVITGRNLLAGLLFLLLVASGVRIFYASLDEVRKNYFLNKIPVWNYFRSYKTQSVDNLLKDRKAEKADHSSLSTFDFAESYHENANLRAIFWKKSLCLIRDHPLLGVGAGNWRLTIPSCREPANPEHTIRNYTYSQPHNEWIGILSELGIPGAILAVFIFFVPLMAVFLRICRKGSSPALPAVFYSAFILGFFLFASFDFPLKRVEHNVLLFSAFAFMLHYVPYHGFSLPSLSGFSSLPDKLRPVIWIPALAGILLTLVIVTFRITGEYYTVGMFRNEYKNDREVIRYAQLAQNPFYRVTPNTLPLAWFEGVAQYRLGQAGPARECFRKALRFTPWEVRVLNDYAVSVYSTGNPAEAVRILQQTLSIDPFFDDARFNLGAIWYLMGKRESALAVIRQCWDSQKKRDFLEELAK